MKGWNLKILGIDWDLYKFYLMFLSREIDLKLFQNYAKMYIFKICRIKQIIFNKYATNLKPTISQRVWETQICSYYNLNLIIINFSFLIDIFDNTIYASGTCHQNSNQLQCSIIDMRLHLYHMTTDQYTALLLEGVLVTSYGRISYIYTFWYNFDTVLCSFLETWISDR